MNYTNMLQNELVISTCNGLFFVDLTQEGLIDKQYAYLQGAQLSSVKVLQQDFYLIFNTDFQIFQRSTKTITRTLKANSWFPKSLVNVNDSMLSNGTLYIAKSRNALTMIDIDTTGDQIEKVTVVKVKDSAEQEN